MTHFHATSQVGTSPPASTSHSLSIFGAHSFSLDFSLYFNFLVISCPALCTLVLSCLTSSFTFSKNWALVFEQMLTFFPILAVFNKQLFIQRGSCFNPSLDLRRVGMRFPLDHPTTPTSLGFLNQDSPQHERYPLLPRRERPTPVSLLILFGLPSGDETLVLFVGV